MAHKNLSITLPTTGFQKFMHFNRSEIEIRESRLFCYLWTQIGSEVEDSFSFCVSKGDALRQANGLKDYLSRVGRTPSPWAVDPDHKFEKPAGIVFPPPMPVRILSCTSRDDDAELALHYYALGAKKSMEADEKDNGSIEFEACSVAIAVSDLASHVDFLCLFNTASEKVSK